MSRAAKEGRKNYDGTKRRRATIRTISRPLPGAEPVRERRSSLEEEIKKAGG